jgi:predicted transcriptional regulator
VDFCWQSDAYGFHCGCVCDSNTPISQQKNCKKIICDTLQPVKQTKPKTQFSVRLPEEVIALLDEIAANTGLNITRNNVVEQSCEWFVRTYRANSNRTLTEADMRDLEKFLAEKLTQNFSRSILNDEKNPAEPHGSSILDPSADSAGGSKTATTPTRHPTKKRKSST